jgi:hypothetical protein
MDRSKLMETNSIHIFSTLLLRQWLVPPMVTPVAPPPKNLFGMCLFPKLIYPLFVLGFG